MRRNAQPLGEGRVMPFWRAGVAAVLCLVAAIVARGHTVTPPALAQSAARVNYPAGWNLVGGPTGTTLQGAAGPLYTLQYGDERYKAVANGTLLTGGYGFWAYFPNGGAATLGAGGPCVVAVPIGAATWIMVGNPWPAGTVTARGADLVETYTPAAGCRRNVTLKPGQAAWAWASVKTTVALAVDGCTTVGSIPPSPPVPPAAQ
jgi:hypothetical protein